MDGGARCRYVGGLDECTSYVTNGGYGQWDNDQWITDWNGMGDGGRCRGKDEDCEAASAE